MPSRTQDDDSCFLCKPDLQLLYHRNPMWQAVCGLGPITDGYTVVSPREHAPLLERFTSEALTEYSCYLQTIRNALRRTYGTPLLAEHGRMPMCRSHPRAGNQIYHQHFLLFPGMSLDFFGEAVDNATDRSSASSLHDAINRLPRCDPYILLSPDESNYLILSYPSGYPPQYIRYVAARALLDEKRGSWRHYPYKQRAVKAAETLRLHMNEERCKRW